MSTHATPEMDHARMAALAVAYRIVDMEPDMDALRDAIGPDRCRDLISAYHHIARGVYDILGG